MGSNQPQSEKSKFEQIGEFVSIFQRGEVWYVNYMENGRQVRQSLRTTKKKQARLEAQKIETRLLAGDSKPQKDVSAAELIHAYRDHVECGSLARKTKQKYRRVLNDVEQMTGATASAQGIDFRFMDRYRAKRLKTVTESTVCDEVVIIQQMMKFGVQRRLIASNPLAGYKVKEPKPKRQPCWTHEVGEQIIAESPPGVYQVAFRVLKDTGMRSGELTHLQQSDIDFVNNVIHIREKTWKYGDEVRSWRPKTGDQRAVPMSEDVVTALKSLPRKSDWVFLAPASWKYPDGKHRLTSTRLLKSVKRVLKKLSLEGHIHTFRHTFISHALTQGIPEATVRSWVGHVDDEILRRYTHIADRVSQQQMEALTQNRANRSDCSC